MQPAAHRSGDHRLAVVRVELGQQVVIGQRDRAALAENLLLAPFECGVERAEPVLGDDGDRGRRLVRDRAQQPVGDGVQAGDLAQVEHEPLGREPVRRAQRELGGGEVDVAAQREQGDRAVGRARARSARGRRRAERGAGTVTSHLGAARLGRRVVQQVQAEALGQQLHASTPADACSRARPAAG